MDTGPNINPRRRLALADPRRLLVDSGATQHRFGQVGGLGGGDCLAGTSVIRYPVDRGGDEWFRPPVLDTTAVGYLVTGRLSPVP